MKLLLSLVVLLLGASASAGLVIHAAEMGIGKFHRYDNKVHPYEITNAWKPYILANNAPTQTPVVQNNADGSVTIFFSSLQELLVTSVKLATERNQQIQVLNINAHGMPGGMWFPKNPAQRDGFECYQWRQAASAPDKSNYDQYYSPVSKGEINQLKATGQTPAHYACVVGVPEWREVTATIPNLKSFFAEDAQVHFLSCLVGYGPVGEAYATSVAATLMGGEHSMLKSALKFGLGDWSMPEGMSFWDYINDQQLSHDNEIYPVNRKDREIMQKGPIRVAHRQNGQWIASVVADQDFMMMGAQVPGFSNEGRIFINYHKPMLDIMLPTEVRIPGTAFNTIRMQ